VVAGLRLRYTIHAKTLDARAQPHRLCLEKHLDGGLPSLQREKAFANSQNLGGGKFWLFAENLSFKIFIEVSL
jgi:hypothetical protein